MIKFRFQLGKTARATHPYSSCPAVSSTSRSATSSPMVTCLRYESVAVGRRQAALQTGETKLMSARTFNGGVVLVNEVALDKLNSQSRLPNTWTNILEQAAKLSTLVKASINLPPPPTTTSLYSLRNWA